METEDKRWEFSLLIELDELLKWFALWENRGSERNFEHIYIAYKSNALYKGMYIKDIAGIISVCLDKLVKDGYVNENKNGISINLDAQNKIIETRYGITFEGLLFLETEISYSNYFYEKNLAKNHAEQVEKAMLVNNKWTKSGTVIAGFATSFLVLIELIKMYYDPKTQTLALIEISTFLFVFLCGIISGIIIYMLIIRELTQRKNK